MNPAELLWLKVTGAIFPLHATERDETVGLDVSAQGKDASGQRNGIGRLNADAWRARPAALK
jgi:hypothetical protein